MCMMTSSVQASEQAQQLRQGLGALQGMAVQPGRSRVKRVSLMLPLLVSTSKKVEWPGAQYMRAQQSDFSLAMSAGCA